MDQRSTVIDMPAASAERREAGERFLRALQKLGLDPEALLWAFEGDEDGRMVLVLVTSFFDFVGPLEVSRLLFKAYNAAAMPEDISPLIVRMHSPKQALGRSLLNVGHAIDTSTGKKIPMGPGSLWASEEGLSFAYEGIIKWPARVIPRTEQKRRWERFSRKVESLAA